MRTFPPQCAWPDDHSTRLVRGLGLHRTLASYNVPKANLPTIAKLALAAVGNPELQPRVEALLESIYDA